MWRWVDVKHETNEDWIIFKNHLIYWILDLLLVGSIFIRFSKDVRDVFCTEKKHPIDKSPLCPVGEES